ncbi:MAG: hypothetical protein ACREEE_05810 [Dongiaceae bacterium]
MTGPPVALDDHRGMMAQRATEIRRRLGQVEADQTALRQHREEFEKLLLIAPATTPSEVVERARYLITLLAGTSVGRDPRHQKLINAVFNDLAMLSGGPPEAPLTRPPEP